MSARTERPGLTVHAECDSFVVVRYERAGQWWIESNRKYVPARHVGVAEAAVCAREAEEEFGGTIHLGLPGGRIFDRKVWALRERWDGEA